MAVTATSGTTIVHISHPLTATYDGLATVPGPSVARWWRGVARLVLYTCAPWTTLSGVDIAVQVWLNIALPGCARPCTDSGDVPMAHALSFRDTYCTGLTDRSPYRAGIVVNAR